MKQIFFVIRKLGTIIFLTFLIGVLYFFIPNRNHDLFFIEPRDNYYVIHVEEI